MKKKVLLLSLLLCSPIAGATQDNAPDKLTSEDLLEDAQAWAPQTIAKLSPEECALLANYLYFNFLSHRYDFLLKSSIISNYTKILSLNYVIATNDQEARKAAQVISENCTTLMQQILPLRAYATKAAAACYSHIEESDYVALKKSIVAFQNYSRAVMNEFIKQDWPHAITQLINACSETIDKEHEKLTGCSTVLKHVQAVEKDTKDLAYTKQFEMALSNADQAFNTLSTIGVGAINVKSMAADIVNINVVIHTVFYNMLLKNLKSNKKIRSCMIMFDQNGYIEPEDRDETLQMLDEKFTIDPKHLNN